MNALDLMSARWRKSSRSGDTGGECVEVAGLPGMIAVRDSKAPAGPVLGFDRGAFELLARRIRAGRYDLPGDRP